MFYSHAMIDGYTDLVTLLFVCFNEEPVCVYCENAHTCAARDQL